MNSDLLNQTIWLIGMTSEFPWHTLLGRNKLPVDNGRSAWAENWGTDDFGHWVTFSTAAVDGTRVTQKLRWCRPGGFIMGAPADEMGRNEMEGPTHTVRVDTGFWLFDTPCTQALWQAVMVANPSRFIDPARPVEKVSFVEAQQFLDRLNNGLPGLALSLPSEAQWEYACRAGTDTATYAGPLEAPNAASAQMLDAICWYIGNSGADFDLQNGQEFGGHLEKKYGFKRCGTRKVGLKRPNAWGLHDMLGNVNEWCADAYHDDYQGAPLDGSEWEVGPVGLLNVGVMRGGSYAGIADSVRAAFRYPVLRTDCSDALGFRCARV